MLQKDNSGNKTEREKSKTFLEVAIVAGILLLTFAQWICHRRIPFMMDDFWYATNLKTDKPLQGLSDILESQIWHFMNWGGRCVTHGLLQVTLMSGEFAADILNLAATLLLGWMICVMAGWKRPFAFLLALSLPIALNANAKMSMFWQAGCVNYVYSSLWILAFLWPYFRQIEKPESKSLPLASLWMLPLGLMAGWSNENMGPACVLITAAIAAYLKKKRSQRIQPWMLSGTLTCFLGSILVVAAPGNFVRVSAVEKKALGEFLYDRFFSMLRAGADYLFPAAALLTALLLLWTVCLKEKLRPAWWLLLALVILSYGAMALSPHYPDRATFGTMVICIVLSLSVLKAILEKRKDLSVCAGCMALCYWLYALYALWGMQ